MENINEKLKNVEVNKVIRVKLTRGKGTPEDPVRIIYQYWDMEGNLIKDNDTFFKSSGQVVKKIGLSFDKS